MQQCGTESGFALKKLSSICFLFHVFFFFFWRVTGAETKWTRCKDNEMACSELCQDTEDSDVDGSECPGCKSSSTQYPNAQYPNVYDLGLLLETTP